MSRIGLFGGTFDPVHNGHVSIARSFLNSGLIDELWVLLTPFPPHKNEQNHVSYQTRLTMLKSALGDLDHIKIVTVEKDLPKPSYTYQTIHHLIEQFPNHTFYYCMGQDSLVNFHMWKFYDKILDQVDLIVAQRPGEHLDNVTMKILKQTVFVDHEPINISSSEIREYNKLGQPIDHLIPEAVFQIINQDQLYQ